MTGNQKRRNMQEMFKELEIEKKPSPTFQERFGNFKKRFGSPQEKWDKLKSSRFARYTLSAAIAGLVVLSAVKFIPPAYGQIKDWNQSRIIQSYQADYAKIQNYALLGQYGPADTLITSLEQRMAEDISPGSVSLLEDVTQFDHDRIHPVIQATQTQQARDLYQTQTEQARPTYTSTPSLTPTITETPTITLTQTITLTSTRTYTPTKTPTSTRTSTPTKTITPTPSLTKTPADTSTPRPLIYNTPIPITDLTNFEVISSVQKNSTGIYVQAGDTMQFNIVGGAWTGDSSKGDLYGACGFAWDDPVPSHTWLFPPSQRGAALVGYIGSTPFFIGCNSDDITANASGSLYLGMSDCLECYGDNVGSIYVNISHR